jgi:signal transduction histidine kinase
MEAFNYLIIALISLVALVFVYVFFYRKNFSTIALHFLSFFILFFIIFWGTFNLFMAEVGFITIMLQSFIAALVTLGPDLPQKKLPHFLDKLFPRREYNPEDFLNQITDELTSTTVVPEILYKTFSSLERVMKTKNAFFVLAADEKIKSVHSFGYKSVLSIDLEDAKLMWKEDSVAIYKLSNRNPKRSIFDKYNAEVCFALKTKNYLAGLMFLGPKKSGRPYSPHDIKFLKTLSRELAITIQNAMQYEEICNFANVLHKEIKKSTESLVKSNERLKELDKAKDQFLAMASHQLRTPLTTIKGYLYMLKEGDFGSLTEVQQEGISEAYENSDRMERLIDDLLNISRIDTGKFVLLYEPSNIVGIVKDEVDRLRTRAESRGLFIKVEVLSEIDKKIMVDKLKLGQVITNFIENSIYYTREGGITVVIDKDKKGVTVLVKDTGTGVPEDQQDHLFEKFFRGPNAQRLRPDGSGLGLFLAKRVIEAHHGEIIFESKPGYGSIFGFTVPWNTGYNPRKDLQTSPTMFGKTIVAIKKD